MGRKEMSRRTSRCLAASTVSRIGRENPAQREGGSGSEEGGRKKARKCDREGDYEEGQ